MCNNPIIEKKLSNVQSVSASISAHSCIIIQLLSSSTKPSQKVSSSSSQKRFKKSISSFSSISCECVITSAVFVFSVFVSGSLSVSSSTMIVVCSVTFLLPVCVFCALLVYMSDALALELWPKWKEY